MTTEPLTDFSPLSRALHELELSIRDTKGVLADVLRGAVVRGGSGAEAQAAGDRLNVRFERLREELRKYLPQQLAMRASELLGEYLRVGDRIDSQGTPDGARWLDDVERFLKTVAGARIDSAPDEEREGGPSDAVSLARTVIGKYGADADKPSVHLAKALIDGAHNRDRVRAHAGARIDACHQIERRSMRGSWASPAWYAEIAAAHVERETLEGVLRILNSAEDTVHEAPSGGADMIRGLVRCAESAERMGGGALWDDTSRKALEAARAAGWGNNKVGRLDGMPGVDEVARKAIADLVERADRDVRRYSRLRILGVAPFGTKQLEAGSVLRFQNLDDFVDADIKEYPHRGEADVRVDVPLTGFGTGAVMTTRGERQRHLYDAGDGSRYCKWCAEEEYHPVHIARASWEESPAVRDQPWVAALKHSDAIRRDVERGLTSAQIRDEIIGKVGMMASARTPEMQARYDAALERERLDAQPAPTKESIDRKVEFELAVIAARTATHGTPDSWRTLSIGDIRRMAKVVLAHAGEGPVTPPAGHARALTEQQLSTALRCSVDEWSTSATEGTLFDLWCNHVGVTANTYESTLAYAAFRAAREYFRPAPWARIVYEVPPAPLVVDEPSTLQDRQEALRIALDEMRRALMALRLEVPQSVADEMLKRFEAVVEAFRRRHAGPSAELVALRFFHDNVTHSIRLISHIMRADTTAEQAFHQLAEQVLQNSGHALMKPRALDAITVTVSGTTPAAATGGTVVSAGTWTEMPPVTVTKGTDGTYSVGPPPDGRPVAEHLDELAAGKVVTVRPYRCDGKHTLAICPDPQCVYRGAEKTPEERVIDRARRVVSRGIHHRRTLDEMMRGKDLNLLHNDLQGLIWLAEAVSALDKEKP